MPAPINRRQWLSLAGGAAAAPFVISSNAGAQQEVHWPARQVRYVNGFPAGGATDVLSRILCQRMSELSSHSFVVENPGGARGVLGADAIAKSQQDG